MGVGLCVWGGLSVVVGWARHGLRRRLRCGSKFKVSVLLLWIIWVIVYRT